MPRQSLVVNGRYRIFYQSETHRYERMAIMNYIGEDEGNRAHVFDARPEAGTQILPWDWIQKVEPVSQGTPAGMNLRSTRPGRRS